MTSNQRIRILMWGVIFVGVGLLLIMTATTCIQAQGDPLPTPTDIGPDRGQDRDRDDDNDKPLGAYIELQASGAPAAAWSVVQWQDSTGDWHDVEGWRGALDRTGQWQWWVAAKDFGTGPFRWSVTQGPNGVQLATSQPFMLPAGADQKVRVNVLVE